MRKILIVALLFLGSVATIFAADVSEETARRAGVNYFANRAGYDVSEVVISNVVTEQSKGENAYFAFNIQPEGFVIVSAEDAFYPILGYSLEGEFSLIDASQNIIGWMGQYIDNINYLRENNIQANAENSTKWAQLTSLDADKTLETKEIVVEPLMPAMWNQDSPYNWYSPEAVGGAGGRCYAGCVATAMSMVMYYWRWPFEGEGTHSYSSDYGTLTANFGDTFYDFNGMVNSSDTKLCDPIALLMYHCAVSVDMMFSPDGSGAFSGDVPGAIKSHFKYDNSAVQEIRGSTGSWISLLWAQLDQGYPLYYSGSSSDGGHAFVCDGYDEDFMYHFNFGWSGSGNGWFSLNDVGGYSMNNAIIKNFIPAQSQYPECASDATVITAKFGSIMDCSATNVDYSSNLIQKWLVSPQTAQDSITDIDVVWTEMDIAAGDVVRLYDGADETAVLIGEYTGTELPSNVTTSSNQLFVVFESDGADEAAGFTLEFFASSPSWCMGVSTFTDFTGVVTDGSGTFNYNNSSGCMFMIDLDNAASINLTFVEFALANDNDKVEIYDAITNEKLATYTYENLPPAELNVASNSVLIAFNTDASNTDGGFVIEYAGQVGVTEVADLLGLNVAPNPASDQLTLSFTTLQASQVKVTLYDLNGRSVLVDEFTSAAGSLMKTVDVSGLSRGVYLLNVISDNQVQTKRVVLQ